MKESEYLSAILESKKSELIALTGTYEIKNTADLQMKISTLEREINELESRFKIARERVEEEEDGHFINNFKDKNNLYYARTESASITGDTVGDPLKDTSGPSLNILIKLSSILSVVFSPLFMKTSYFAKK